MDFFVDYHVTFWSELASIMLDRRVIRIDLELMSHNIWADVSRVLVKSGEAVMMLLKELDESKAKV